MKQLLTVIFLAFTLSLFLSAPAVAAAPVKPHKIHKWHHRHHHHHHHHRHHHKIIVS